MAVITVTSTADSGSGSLRQAIADAASGDTIVFDDALEEGGVITILLSSQLNIGAKEITIDGGSHTGSGATLATRVILDGQNATYLLNYGYAAGAFTKTFSGLTFQNGSRASGSGGALYNERAGIVGNFNNCVFYNNSAPQHGGAVFVYGANQTNFKNCTFKNNTATSNNGGALYNTVGSIITCENCTFKNNTAGSSGTDVYLYTSSGGVVVKDCTFETSTNKSNIYNVSTSGTLELQGTNSAPFLQTTSNTAVIISDKTTVGSLTIANGATVTFSGVDSVLAVTTTATIGSATFTAAENSNGFLAVPVNTNISSATFTGVVACNYGAGITAFRYRYPNVIYTATNISIPALLQKSDSGSQPWTSVALISESPYNYEQSTPTTFRLFDGATFLYSAFSGIGKHFETTAKFPIGYLVTKNTIGYLN